MPDTFTRLILSILATGIAPRSFYETDADGRPQRAHYDGLPVDFVAESIITLGAKPTDGFRSFDVMNPRDDGVSLDTFVDWLINAGHKITRIEQYEEWLSRFETALTALPERGGDTACCLCWTRIASRRGRYGVPLAPTEVFHGAVRAAKIGVDQDIPHVSASLIDKYVADLQRLDLV